MVTDEIVLPPQLAKDSNKKTLVLDLDETLVHSSFSPLDVCDLVLPVSLSNQRLRSTTLAVMYMYSKDLVWMNSFKDALSTMN